jgi:hypothetical protein
MAGKHHDFAMRLFVGGTICGWNLMSPTWRQTKKWVALNQISGWHLIKASFLDIDPEPAPIDSRRSRHTLTLDQSIN